LVAALGVRSVDGWAALWVQAWALEKAAAKAKPSGGERALEKETAKGQSW